MTVGSAIDELRRGVNETNLDYARRVFLHIKRGYGCGRSFQPHCNPGAKQARVPVGLGRSRVRIEVGCPSLSLT